jgi:hypothetical protein
MFCIHKGRPVDDAGVKLKRGADTKYHRSNPASMRRHPCLLLWTAEADEHRSRPRFIDARHALGVFLRCQRRNGGEYVPAIRNPGNAARSLAVER